jgi:citrate synthase
VVTSTRAEPEPVISASIGSLSGPAHGGANEAAIRLFVDIGSPANVETYISGLLERKERIPGFGHRIYRVKDPRSAVIQRLAALPGLLRPVEQNYYQISLAIETIMEARLAARGLFPNVDLFSGVVFHSLDIPIDFFTPIFAASRTAGWAANLKEQLESGNRLFRPTQIYVGEKPRAL